MSGIEEYDLKEQEHRHAQERQEAANRQRRRMARIEAAKVAAVAVPVSAVLCTGIFHWYTYASGPVEVSPQQKHRQEVELACLDKGGIILGGKCVFSEKSAKEVME